MKILIGGYYGSGNLGDELVLSSMLSQIKGRVSDAAPSVISANPAQTSAQTGLPAVHKWNPAGLIRHMDDCDLFILGGGGLIQDSTSFASLAYYLGLVEASLLFGKPVFVYAVGVEKVSTLLGRAWVKRLFSREDVRVTVRDLPSKTFLEQIGVKGDKVFVTADPVLSRPFPVQQEPTEKTSREILFIPRFCADPSRKEWQGKVVRAALEFGRVKAMVFQEASEKKIMEEPWAAQVEWLEAPSIEKPESFERPFLSSDLVISERFHALVLASLAGKPMAGGGNPEKVGRFCQSRGAPFFKADQSEQDIAAQLKRLLETERDQADTTLDIWINSSSLTPQLLP